MSSKFHRVFWLDADGAVRRVADVPWADDDNGGLPDWYFEGDYLALEIDPAKDTVEWVPACGPAPCWLAKFSSFADDAAMVAAHAAWAREVY